MALSTADLASMRADAQALMPDECTVLRPTEVSDGQGGFTQTWATVDSYACNLASGPYMRFGAERVSAGQVTPVAVVFISMPHDADVHPQDVIAWTPQGAGAAEQNIEVTQASARSWDINLRVAGKEVGAPE